MRRTQSHAPARTFYGSYATNYDPFAVHPIRRSAIASLISGLLLIGAPLVFGTSSNVTTGIYLTVGWILAAVFVLAVPILLISLLEAGWRGLKCHVHPSVSELDLSPRVANLLRRHHFETLDDIERTPDGVMLLLSNFDAEALREVRRAISLFRYAERQRRRDAERQHEAEQRMAGARSAKSRPRRLARSLWASLQARDSGEPRP